MKQYIPFYIVLLLLVTIVLIWKFNRDRINPRSYQIEVYSTTIELYDGDRFVGKVNYINTELDNLICKDNQ